MNLLICCNCLGFLESITPAGWCAAAVGVSAICKMVSVLNAMTRDVRDQSAGIEREITLDLK